MRGNLRAEILDSVVNDDTKAKQQIMKQFVVETEVDSQMKTAEGRFVDPRLLRARYVVAPGGVEPPPRP